MTEKQFDIEKFKDVVSELFEIDKKILHPNYDLSGLIKDSIDLGELVAILKSRYGVEPRNWELFKVETKLEKVFKNFS